MAVIFGIFSGIIFGIYLQAGALVITTIIVIAVAIRILRSESQNDKLLEFCFLFPIFHILSAWIIFYAASGQTFIQDLFMNYVLR